MSQTNVVNRAYIMIGGKPLPSLGLIKSLDVDIGEIASHVQTMSTNRMPYILDKNFAPSIRWTEIIIFNDGTTYNVNLIKILADPFFKPTLIIPEFKASTIEADRVFGRVHMLGNCTLSLMSNSYPGQETEGTISWSAIGCSYDVIDNPPGNINAVVSQFGL